MQGEHKMLVRKHEKFENSFIHKCDTAKGMSHMLAIFNFDFSIKITCLFKMLHFDPNPISIGHLVAEI